MRVIPLAVYGVWHGGALARGIAGFLHFHASPSRDLPKTWLADPRDRNQRRDVPDQTSRGRTCR